MRRTHHSTFITTVPLVAGIIGIATQGCARKPAEKPIEHTIRKVTPETTPGSAKTEPNIKGQFERSLTLKLERLDEDIREVRAKVANLTAEAQTEWTEKMAANFCRALWRSSARRASFSPGAAKAGWHRGRQVAARHDIETTTFRNMTGAPFGVGIPASS